MHSVWFNISSRNRWSEKDGAFNYRNFYYAVLDIIEDCVDKKWTDSLLQFHNQYVIDILFRSLITCLVGHTVLFLGTKTSAKVQTPRMVQARRAVAHLVPSLQDCMPKDKHVPRSFERATSRMVQRQQRSMGEPSEREHYSLYC